MILSLLERLELQGGSAACRPDGPASRAFWGEGSAGGRGRWFQVLGDEAYFPELQPVATSSGRLASASTLVAERTDDGVFVAPRRPGHQERIVWVGDLELAEVGGGTENNVGRLSKPNFELHPDGMGLSLTWAVRRGRKDGLPQQYGLRMSLPCRPAGEVTFTNDDLDPEVWLSATRSGLMAARMRPYAGLPELEVVPTAGSLTFDPAPEWRLGLSVMDPDGRLRSEDRFSPGTFRWSVPGGSSTLSLSIRMIADAQGPRVSRSGELGSLLARPSSPVAAEAPAERVLTPEELRDRALVLPGDVIKRRLSSHAVASELRQLLLHAAPYVNGARFDVALWAARAAFLLAPQHSKDVTSVTLPFMLGVVRRIEEEANAAGCPGAAAAGLPRWCASSCAVGAEQIPIELAALLHQAAVHTAQLATGAGQESAAKGARATARRLRRWFQGEFWLARPDRARDLGVLRRDASSAASALDDVRGLSLRPHMLLAASFEGAPLSTAQRRVLVRVAESRLLVAPLGLATLDSDDLEFDGHSLENGAVWPFLIGPFVEASLRAFGQDRGRRRLLMQLTSAPLLDASPMAWAHTGGTAVSPKPYLGASDSHSAGQHPLPLGPLKYALNIAERARARRLLDLEGRRS